MTQSTVTSIHRKVAIAAFSVAGVLVLASFAALIYALRLTEVDAPHWPAVTWQIGQMLAIVSFAFGMWQVQKHRRWKLKHGYEEENVWD